MLLQGTTNDDLTELGSN